MLRLDDGITGIYDAKVIEVSPEKHIPISGITKAETTVTGELGIPEKVTDIFTQPLIVTGLETAWDFWSLLLGSPEQKIESLGGYLPITEGSQELLKTPIQQAIEEKQEWVTTPTLPTGQTIDIKLPTLPDITGALKWIGIGIIAIAGIWGASKIFGKKGR